MQAASDTSELTNHAAPRLDMTAVAEVEIAGPPERAFDIAVSTDAMPDLFRGSGPVPGILRAEIVGGGPLQEGAMRRVMNADGSIVDESILALERPRLQAYRIESGLRLPFILLVRGGGGRWTFEPTPAGTRVRWELTFLLTTALVRPIARRILRGHFQPAMQEALERLKERVEAPQS